MTGRLTEATFSVPQGARFAIVAARWNEAIVDPMVQGALAALREHGIVDRNIDVVRVPGAFELPVICKQLAARGEVAALIALGCVIRGDTPHFEYVAGSAAQGLTQVAVESGVPIAFGVLTTETTAQAWQRADVARENKGGEAARCALEMASLVAQIESGGKAASPRAAKTAKKRMPVKRKKLPGKKKGR